MSVSAGVLSEHLGYWTGNVKTKEGQSLQFGVELFIREDGSAWASVSQIFNNNFNIPAVKVEERDNTINVELDGAAMILEWKVDHFEAKWSYPGGSDDLVMNKVENLPRLARPQNPSLPFPYTNESLAIKSDDGVVLSATLSIPKSQERPSLVILVAGSGPQTRDAENFGHKTFLVLADHLARSGIAVIRYDKRGVGKSSGDFANHTLPQLVSDLRAVLNEARRRNQFQHIGFIGHSEGATVAVIAAAGNPNAVDFMVSMAGVGLSGIDNMILQDRLYAKSQGASKSELNLVMPYVRDFYRLIISNEDPKLRIDSLKQHYQAASEAVKSLIEKYKMNVGTLSLEWAEKPFLRVSLMEDSHNSWKSIKVPVLALNGDADLQVPVENLIGIQKALKESQNLSSHFVKLHSVNHGFQTVRSRSDLDPSKIDETIAPVVLGKITSLVRQIQ